jgi:hypothetical protein
MARSLWRWLAVFASFPLGGLAAMLIVGPIDTIPAAIVGGLITGGVIGLGQWSALAGRVSAWWILATAVGLSVGLTIGVALSALSGSSYSLPIIVVASALSVAIAQVVVAPPLRRLVWMPLVAVSWVLGWVVAWSIGIDIAQHFTVFGASGAAVFTVIIGLAVTLPAKQHAVTA